MSMLWINLFFPFALCEMLLMLFGETILIHKYLNTFDDNIYRLPFPYVFITNTRT